MKYEITEEQLKELAKGNAKVERWFPELFKTKLEDNTWYKFHSGAIQFNIKDGEGYGINDDSDWHNPVIWLKNYKPNQYRPATESEVFEALKNEADKIGFRGGLTIDRSKMSSNTDTVKIPNGDKYFYDFNFNILYLNEKKIFNSGIWASIIKETPEDFLNEIFNKDFICKNDKEEYPNSVFYFQGETYLLEIEKTEDKLIAWVNYNKIWNPISSKFGLNYDQTQELLKARIEEHFKLRDVTPSIVGNFVCKKIEEHFKLRDVTPTLSVPR